MPVPEVIDLSIEEDDPLSPRSTRRTRLDDHLQLARNEGIYLELSEEHKASPARQRAILEFLLNMREIREAEARAQSAAQGSSSLSRGLPTLAMNAEDPRVVAAQNGESRASTASLDVGALSRKRKSFALNAVCRNCGQQFDENDNHHRSCLYHPGPLQPAAEHKHWALYENGCLDDRVPASYDGEFPDAWQWMCCGRWAEAGGCTSSGHVESTFSKKARLTT